MHFLSEVGRARSDPRKIFPAKEWDGEYLEYSRGEQTLPPEANVCYALLTESLTEARENLSAEARFEWKWVPGGGGGGWLGGGGCGGGGRTRLHTDDSESAFRQKLKHPKARTPPSARR